MRMPMQAMNIAITCAKEQSLKLPSLGIGI